MLEDIYLEYLITKKKNGKQKAIIALVIAGAVIVSLVLIYLIFALAYAFIDPETGTSQAGSFIFSIGLVLVALAWYGAYLLITMQNIEYEYILTNSEMDIDKVMSKKGRQPVVSFDFKNVTVCAAIDDNDHNHDYKNVTPVKIYDAVGDKNNGGIYFADFSNENGYVRVLFQPTYKMITAAKRFNPRKIFVKE